jgi:hypothetical protein
VIVFCRFCVHLRLDGVSKQRLDIQGKDCGGACAGAYAGARTGVDLVAVANLVGESRRFEGHGGGAEII